MRKKVLGDAFTFRGAGQMEAAVAALAAAGDGGPILTTDEALLERAEQPPSAAASGPPQPAPRLRAGCSMWPLLGHSPPGARGSWAGAAGSKTFVPELLGGGGPSFLGSGLSSPKPLLTQSSLTLSTTRSSTQGMSSGINLRCPDSSSCQ